LLYEVLAGSTPLEKERLRAAAFDEILRMIGEEEPPKPSMRLSSSEALPSIAANRNLEPEKLTSLVSGDLDWIVMKCLEKERAGRYDSANQVAEELRRFLADEPVVLGVMHLALFAIVQFFVRQPSSSELLISAMPNAITVLLCLVGVGIGVAAFRGKPHGLWVSLIAFVLFVVGNSWSLWWAISLSREISNIPLYSFSSFMPSTREGTNAFIRNCVIGSAWLGMTWAIIGLLLQIHALYAKRCSTLPTTNSQPITFR
jgi:hypothetical protein